MRKLALLLALFCGMTPGRASAADKWVVVSLPGLRLADLDDARLPTLRALAQTGAVALMNTTTAAGFRADSDGASDLASAYLTLGTARRAAAPPLPSAGSAARELPRALWQTLAARNPGLDLVALPAARLRRAGVRTGLLAAVAEPEGAVALLAVTAPGAPVAAGSAGSRWLRRDVGRPYGVLANTAQITTEAIRLARHVDVLWLDPGDLQRADAYAAWCLPTIAAAHHRAALANLERLLVRLQRTSLLSDRNLLLLTPAVAAARSALAPLVWHGPGVGPGRLASSATHTVGVVTNTDVMPHLIASLSPATGGDSPLHLVLDSDALANLRRTEARALLADRVRRGTMPIAKTWLTLGAFFALSGALAGGKRLHPPGSLMLGGACGTSERAGTTPRSARRTLPPTLAGRGGAPAAAAATQRAVGTSLTWALAVPITAILLGAVVGKAWWVWPTLAAGAVALACLPAEKRLTLAAMWLGAVLLLDLFLGSALLRDSPLGYSLVLGARYYGIGNEWMGYLVGAALIAAMGGLPLALIAALIVLAHPGWGADLGGALTAAVALAGFCWVRGGPRARHGAVLLGLLLAAAVFAAACLDAGRAPEQQSHLGRLVNAIRADGFATLERVALGKLGTNVRIARGFWGLLLACEAGACLWRLTGTLRAWREGLEPSRDREGAGSGAAQSALPGTAPSQSRLDSGASSPDAPGQATGVEQVDPRPRSPTAGIRPPSADGLAVLVLAALAALLFNDSGVIAAALMLSLAPMLPATLPAPPQDTCESPVREPR